MKTKFQEFKERYEFNSGSVKWIAEGGDLLKYIGEEVVYVDYKRSDKGEWNSTVERAKIVTIDDFDPVTMTYHIKYQLLDRESKDEILEERIIPEGFSFDIMGQGIQNSMNRFTPFSLHTLLVEEGQYYKRVDKLWDERGTLPFGALKALNDNKDLTKTLKYAKNIVVAVKPTHEVEGQEDLEYDDQLFVFRLSNLKLKHDYKDSWRLFMTDWDGHTYNVLISEDEDDFYEFSIGQEVIGDLKIIDLMDKREDTTAENKINNAEGQRLVDQLNNPPTEQIEIENNQVEVIDNTR